MPQERPERTILLIDDEAGARKLVKLVLEREGFRVLTAPNGEEGLSVAKLEHPDVILLDLIMPKMDGHEALRQLKNDPATHTIPVIVLTAKGAERDLATSVRLGAACHLEKPYETKELLQKIQATFVSPLQRGVDRPTGSQEGA